jgi:7-dehydrocholesterol reductase
VRGTLLPLALLLACPPFVLLLWTSVVHHDGSLRALVFHLPELLRELPRPSLVAAGMLAAWGGVQWLLLVALPGDTHHGPLTRQGNRPQYRANGVLAFAVTHVAWIVAVATGWLDVSAIYTRYGELLATASLLALATCGALYLKGIFAPSSTDAASSGNVIFDLYWGVELHPRAFGVSLKQWLVCRWAMMGWSVAVLSFAVAQVERHGELSTGLAVSVALQVVYVFKFFLWETGYFDSLDITHDRCGFYIVWGVLAWLPGVYPIASIYLVDHPVHAPALLAVAIAAIGIGAIAVNYAADEQRRRVRASCGQARVWGSEPRLIRAPYTTADGERRVNLLLVSGYWGIARHFHYLPELLVAAAWTLPVGLGAPLPWFYVVFLAILLVDRAARDDRRCADKYGEAWDRYRRIVPWRILPGVY